MSFTLIQDGRGGGLEGMVLIGTLKGIFVARVTLDGQGYLTHFVTHPPGIREESLPYCSWYLAAPGTPALSSTTPPRMGPTPGTTGAAALPLRDPRCTLCGLPPSAFALFERCTGSLSTRCALIVYPTLGCGHLQKGLKTKWEVQPLCGLGCG